jgi:hypothetical protein
VRRPWFVSSGARLVNFRRLVAFKRFQEVGDSGLQRSRLILSVGGLEFVADEVPEQAEVSSFFFRRLKIFCPHVLAHRWLPATKIRVGREIITLIERYN